MSDCFLSIVALWFISVKLLNFSEIAKGGGFNC